MGESCEARKTERKGYFLCGTQTSEVVSRYNLGGIGESTF